jgi:hypothetical protein
MSRWWGWSSETAMPETGYFFCPECQSRQRTGAYQTTRRFNICRVTVYSKVEAPFYFCEGCRHTYLAEDGLGYDFSASPEPSTWVCFKCGAAAPGHSFTCPQCGFSLNRTLESLSGKDANP